MADKCRFVGLPVGYEVILNRVLARCVTCRQLIEMLELEARYLGHETTAHGLSDVFQANVARKCSWCHSRAEFVWVACGGEAILMEDWPVKRAVKVEGDVNAEQRDN